MAIGTAVGADGSNGVLKPASFSLDGTTTTIKSLKWEDGEVTMALSPTTTLADYAIDFIDATGTTTLSLSDNASTTALTWTVPDAPWSAGDLLMLRLHNPRAAAARDRDDYAPAARRPHVLRPDGQLERPASVRRSLFCVPGYRHLPHSVKGGVIMDRRGVGERSGVALQNCTTRRLL